MKLIYLFIALSFIVFAGGIVSAVGTYPDVDPSMIVYNHFNNQSAYGENDTHVYDFSGNGNNGTVIGGAVHNNTGGYLGDGAFEFNKSNYIQILDSDSLSPWNNGNVSTFSVWFKLNEDETGEGTIARQFIFSKGSSGGGYEYELVRSNITDGRRILFQLYPLDGSSVSSMLVFSNYEPEVWYNVVVVLDGENVKLYKNGVIQNTVAISKLNGDGSTNLNIGTRGDGVGGGSLNGTVEEFIVYNRTLTNKEIWELWDSYNGCLNPSLSMSIYGDTHFCSGDFSLNSTHNSASITIANDNLTVFCNGAKIYGNYTATGSSTAFRSRGIHNTGGYDDILIKDCVIDDYHLAIYSKDATNWTVTNITSTNVSGLLDYQNMTNSYFYNSTVLNGNAFTIETYADNILIKNINCSNSVDNPLTPGQSCMSLVNGRNSIIRDSTFYYSGGVYLSGTNQYNLSILNNQFLTQGITTSTDGRHLIIRDTVNANSSLFFVENNYFENFDKGIQLRNVSDIWIRNNTFFNATRNQDYYDLNIHVEYNTSNLNILDNNFTDFGSTSILLRQTYGANISGNTFSNNYNSLLNGNYDCTDGGANYCNSDPITAIFVEEIYKGFIPFGTQSWYNYTQASQQVSNNISISENTFTNIPVLLRTQGTTNLTHDLNGVYYSAFQLPFYTDKDEFWITNNWNTTNILNNQFNTVMTQGIYNNWSVNYSIFPTYEYYKNVHTDGRNVNLIKFNQTNSLIYFSNNSVACSNINECDGNINITLSPNNYTYVLDNFNLTEGVSREHSPLWISSTSTNNELLEREINIASNITDTIKIDIHVRTGGQSCSRLNKIVYTTQSGVKSIYYGSDARSKCSGDIVSLNEYVELANSSNHILLSFSCTQYEKMIYPLILIFGVLALIIFIFSYVYLAYTNQKININHIIIMFISIVVSTALIRVIASSIAGRCAP